jgi:hypothetical protein
MSGFCGSEFALCHKTFRQMMELSERAQCRVNAGLYGCAAALKLVSERYSDVKFNKVSVKLSELIVFLDIPIAEILFYVSNHFSGINFIRNCISFL